MLTGSTGSSWETGTGSGSSWGGGAGATGGSWQTQTAVGGKPGTANWEWSAGTHQNQSTSSNFGGFFTWQDLMREIQRIQVRLSVMQILKCTTTAVYPCQ